MLWQPGLGCCDFQWREKPSHGAQSDWEYFCLIAQLKTRYIPRYCLYHGQTGLTSTGRPSLGSKRKLVIFSRCPYLGLLGKIIILLKEKWVDIDEYWICSDFEYLVYLVTRRKLLFTYPGSSPLAAASHGSVSCRQVWVWRHMRAGNVSERGKVRML